MAGGWTYVKYVMGVFIFTIKKFYIYIIEIKIIKQS